MPAYNFQSQFAALVESGAKRSTIRPWRKDGRDPKTGDTLYLYTGMRRKECRRLLTAMCLAAAPIEVNSARRYVIADTGKRLTEEQLTTLAKGDGFESVDAFFAFFAGRYGPIVCGLLINW